MKNRYRLIGPQDDGGGPPPQGDRNLLEAHRDSLYQRLELGYARIERGLAEGEEVTTWEDFWVALLGEYERVCDDLQRDLAA